MAMAANNMNRVEVIRQPRHDVFYNPGRGEIVKIIPARGEDRPKRPQLLHANLQLTRLCNLNCSYCRSSSSPAVDTNGELTIQEWMDLFDQLKENGARSVFATGGEIFARPDIWELLVALEERFIVHILTNGYVLGGGLTLHQQHVISRLASVQVSLDSTTPGLHDSFRGKGSWEKAVRALEAVRNLGVKAVISAVVIPGHEVEIKTLSEMAKRLDMDLLLRPLLPQGRGWKQCCGIIELGGFLTQIGKTGQPRGFLAYSEEIHPFGIQPCDAVSCGVVAFDPQGHRKFCLDN